MTSANVSFSPSCAPLQHGLRVHHTAQTSVLSLDPQPDKFDRQRRTGIHLDEDAYMDVDSPPRRPLHPAPSPFASVPPRGPQPPAPSSNFTFDSTSLPYEAFSSARRRSEPTKEVILAPLDGTTDELSTQLGAARVDEPAPSTARRRSKRQGSPKRKLKAKIREDDQPGQLAAPTPSHHYSLHQHHYSAPGEREGDGRHRWREEVPLVMLGCVQPRSLQR